MPKSFFFGRITFTANIRMKNKNKTNTIFFRAITSMVIAFIVLAYTPITLAETDNTNTDTAVEDNNDTGDTTNTEEENTEDEEVTDEAMLELNLQIQERKQRLDELNAKHETYRKNIAIKQQESITLETQVESLDDQINKTEVEIQITETEIETLRLQIKEVTRKISEREEQIVDQKVRLAELIRQINTYQDKNLFEILLQENKFSNFYSQMNYLEDLEHGLKGSLDEVTQLKIDLQVINAELETKESDLNDKKTTLEAEQQELLGQQDYKEQLLQDVLNSESQYQELLSAVKSEQMSVNSEITLIEETIRKQLEGEDLLSIDDSKTLSWPVSPAGGITAYFHDPAYIFRHLFEHPAIDLRAAQGTPVKAAASGYVARAKDAGLGYSYIMIIHANGLSTVYGHISDIKVEEESYVTRGQVIGLSGGMPGTPGAGRLTTGPHLHFEVRLDGIPVNPLDYLP